MILTDVIAAVQIVGRSDGDGRVKSAAAQHRLKEKEKEGKRDIKCLLCSKSHPTFSCSEQLALLRTGQRTLPAGVCKICLQATGDKHPKVCGEKKKILKRRRVSNYQLSVPERLWNQPPLMCLQSRGFNIDRQGSNTCSEEDICCHQGGGTCPGRGRRT